MIIFQKKTTEWCVRSNTHTSCVECPPQPTKTTRNTRGVLLEDHPNEMEIFIYYILYQMGVSKYVERETYLPQRQRPNPLCVTKMSSLDLAVLLCVCVDH